MSKPPTNLQDAIKKWLPIFAETYQREVKTSLFEIWLAALKGLSPSDFETACVKHLRSSQYFPTPAHILSLIAPTSELISDVQAEKAWQHVIDYSWRWHPDIGCYGDCPKITERERRALYSIGGPGLLQETDGTKNFPFIKKDFMVAWKRLEHVGEFPLLESKNKELNAEMESIGAIVKRLPQ